MDEVIDGLEVVYADYSTVMSRADFWVLAAIKAIEFTTKRANGADCDYGSWVLYLSVAYLFNWSTS